LRVDFRHSLELAQMAASLAEDLNDRGLRARSLRAMANAHCVSGSNQRAVELHDQAIAALEECGDESELARTLSATVQPLLLLGQYDRALDAAHRASEIFAREGDEVRLARLELHIGNILHRQDRFTEALASFEHFRAKMLALGDVDGLISALHNQAVTLTALNEFHRALAAYEEARRLCIEHQLPMARAQVDYNIAWLYYLRGEYSRAIELLHAAFGMAKQTGDAYHAALSLLDLSEIYLELNLSADAREMAVQARMRFGVLGMGYEEAKALVNVAIACGQERKTVEALELFAEARALMVREHNHVWPSLIDVYQALLLVEEGRLFEARRISAAALDRFVAAGLRSKAALCRLLLARISLRLEDRTAARRYCDEALETLGPDGTPILVYHARLMLGHVASHAGDRELAYASYDAARAALETLRSRLRGEELKIAFVKNRLEVYERLVELHLYDEGNSACLAEAFTFVEQAKSRSLLDLLLQPVPAFARAQSSESELARSIRDIREELNWYYHLADIEQLRPDAVSQKRLDEFQREIGSREREMVRLLRELGETTGASSDLCEPTIATLDAVRAALPDGACLIEYFQIDERILVCLLDKQRLTIQPVSVVPRVSDHVRMLQFQFSKFRLGQDYVERFRDSLLHSTNAHLGALFAELLEPVWSEVRGRHLIIVPHGLLHYVPFHALFDGERYVIDDCTVSYAPSASVFVECQSRNDASTGSPLILGVPDAQAPYIADESRAVAEALPGARILAGDEATLAALTEQGADSRIVHIATHAQFRPDSPMFSAIRLADGYLNVYDLYRLRLPATLVTLSACATGANVAAGGDELLGLTRGLFATGAHALLLSLWKVHDRSTADLMTAFYREVAGGTPVVHALRHAMLAIRGERPHPYHWAAFTLTGRCTRS
jgi:CHAT domain-containing protein